MEHTRQRTVHDIHTYKITPDLHYVVKAVDDVVESRQLKYVGVIKHPDFDHEVTAHVSYDYLKPALKVSNPFWGNTPYLGGEIPENAEDVDLDKVLLFITYNHTIYDLNKVQQPLPYKSLNYWLSDRYFDLDALAESLKSNPKVLSYTYHEVPHYNRDSESGNNYLEVTLLPTPQDMLSMVGLKESEKKYHLFSRDSEDFLCIHKCLTEIGKHEYFLPSVR